MRNYPGLTVEDMRIEGDYQILQLGGPVVPERNKQLMRMGFGWDDAREAWVRRIPSIEQVEAFALRAMDLRHFDAP